MKIAPCDRCGGAGWVPNPEILKGPADGRIVCPECEGGRVQAVETRTNTFAQKKATPRIALGFRVHSNDEKRIEVTVHPPSKPCRLELIEWQNEQTQLVSACIGELHLLEGASTWSPLPVECDLVPESPLELIFQTIYVAPGLRGMGGYVEGRAFVRPST
jgi:hypothetical protein